MEKYSRGRSVFVFAGDALAMGDRIEGEKDFHSTTDVLSVLLLHEPISPIKVLTALIIISGVYICQKG